MQALILAGGLGSRLRPLTVHTPKPVVPVCNRPFLIYQLENLRRAGVTDVTLSLSYQPHKIEQILGDGSEFGVHLKYTVEAQPMGTAGAYKFAEEHIHQPTIVLNGDILTNLDFADVIRRHKERSAVATIVLTPVENPSAYGLVEVAEGNRVSRFLEKPKADEITTNMINAGTYVLEPEVLDLIPAGEHFMFEHGVFPELLRREAAFYAHTPGSETGDYWIDLGTPERYLQAHLDMISGKVGGVALPVPRVAPDAAQRRIADASEQIADAHINDRSLVATGCTIKPGAQIVDSVIGEGCVIEEDARVERSVIWAHTRVSSGAQVSGAIIGRGCHVGRGCRVGAGAVLGDKTSLTDHTQTRAAS